MSARFDPSRIFCGPTRLFRVPGSGFAEPWWTVRVGVWVCQG